MFYGAENNDLLRDVKCLDDLLRRRLTVLPTRRTSVPLQLLPVSTLTLEARTLYILHYLLFAHLFIYGLHITTLSQTESNDRLTDER